MKYSKSSKVYSVQFNTSEVCTLDGKKQALSGQNYMAIITPRQGYEVTSVTVKCDGKEVENNFENGKLIVSNDVITGNLTIDAETNIKTCKVNVDAEPNACKFIGNKEVSAFQNYEAEIIANKYYEIINVTTKCNDKEIGNFDSKTNKLTIDKDIIVDDLTINVETKHGDLYAIAVDGNKEEFKFVGDHEIPINQDYKATIMPVDGYEIEDVTVKCNANKVGKYNKKTNSLIIYKQDIIGPLSINITTKPIMFNIFGKGNVKFKYSDSFFKNPSTEFNPSLAAASYGIIGSAETCSDGDLSTNGDKYIRKIMVDELELDNYEQIGYCKETSKQSIGLSIGTKELKYGDSIGNKNAKLIVMPIRSAGYQLEWCDNMFVGSDVEYRKIISDFDSKEYEFKSKYANHAGFCLSAQIAIHNLKQYIEKYNLGNEKIVLWIIGYSRGGAVANTIAGLLDRAILENNLDEYFGKDINLQLSKNNIYAYTMATPRPAYINQEPKPYSDAYNNIFNLVDPNDMVPYLPPKQWGFTRYGITKYMSTKTIDPNYDQIKQLRKDFLKADAKIVDAMDDFTPYKIGGDKNLEEFKNVTPQVAWESFMAALVDNIPTREQYRYEWQDKVQNILFGLIGKGDNFTKYITDIISLLPADCRVICWLSTIAHGGKDLIFDFHSHNNYFSYAKGLSPLYAIDGKQLYTLDNWNYYFISTRGFDMSMITDLTDFSISLISCEPKPSPFFSNLPVINQVSACTFDYPLYPYYIDVIVPGGHKYKFDYGSRHVLGSWDGYGRITCYSSDPEKDGKVIYDQKHRASMVYSDYSETLYLE